MKQNVLKGLVVVACSISFLSCTKRELQSTSTPPVDTTGTTSVKLEFENKVGSEKLVLNTTWYKNQNGDSFRVRKFNYYISNIVLKGKNGTYIESESYHLLQHDSASTLSFDLKNVPYDEYDAITLMIGVDSLRNVSGAQTGALDPAYGMFWTWKTGYIMLKLEGESPVSTAFNNIISYHAGGYGGVSGSGFGKDYPTQRTVSLAMSTPIKVNSGNINHVHIDADVNALFKPYVFSFATTPTIMDNGIDSKNLADNYANMLRVTYSGL